jgi:hypothetical protein
MPDVWQFFEFAESTAFPVSNLSHFFGGDSGAVITRMWAGFVR